MENKTDEQIERERSAVDAMRNAKANMTSALDRISTLERELQNAQSSLSRLKSYIAPTVYVYEGKETCHAFADRAITSIAKVLG